MMINTWAAVLFIHLTIGTLFAILLATAVAPRVWPARRDLTWLAGLCVVCVPLYPLVIAFVVALKSDRFYEWVRDVASDEPLNREVGA